MNLADLTTEDILNAVQRALESLEGSNLYTPGPYPFTIKPFAEPMTVIYWGADNNTYERSFDLEMLEDGSLNAVMGERREVESRTLWIPVDGAASYTAMFTFDGGPFAVRKSWKGRIFRAGNYPDKCGEITAEHIKKIASNFNGEMGVQLWDTHNEDTFFTELLKRDGAKLIRVWTQSGDTELHGEIEVPGWLAFAAKKIAKKISVGLEPTLDRLKEVSLCLNPRIIDAEVFADFKAQAALAFSSTPAMAQLRLKLPTLADEINELAAQAKKEAPAPTPGPGDDTMNFSQKVRAFWATLSAEQKAASGLTDADLNNDANFTGPAPAAPDPRDLSFARLSAERVFDGLLLERRVTPKMKESFTGTYVSLLQADGSGKINFSNTGSIVEGDGVKAFLAIFAEIKPQFNVGERLASAPTEFRREGEDEEITAYEAAAAAAAGRKASA